MGFQDRVYVRQQRYAPTMAEWSGVTLVIFLNVSLWLLNFILSGNLFREIFSLQICPNDILMLRANVIEQPWNFWQLLTYGFLHNGPSLELQAAPTYSPFHLLGNMLTLWFFGREVEALTGRAEFLRFYCTAIVLAGLAWVASVRLTGGSPQSPLVGASGGVMAVLAVFVWYFPTQIVLICGVLPVPAWALGLLYFFGDMAGAAHEGFKLPAGDAGGNEQNVKVAHVAHLAGAAFGLLYAWRRWDLSAFTEAPGRLFGRLFSRRSRMRVVRPDDDDGDDGPSLEAEVDRILAKISRSGESSLTPDERLSLTRASRRLRDREGSH